MQRDPLRCPMEWGAARASTCPPAACRLLMNLEMRTFLFPSLLVSLFVAACSSTSATSPDASSDAGTCTGMPPLICDGCCGSKYAADCLDGAWTCAALGIACVVCDAGSTDSAPDDAGDAATCTGTPPLICDGCCGRKYAADQCLNGAWTCVPRGIACAVCDAGTMDSAAYDASGDAATCSGTRPNCFGSNSSLCCGNDPSGQASCNGGAWMCGAVPAPGCNGTSCLLQDAGPG
jgi:hypothetical protein